MNWFPMAAHGPTAVDNWELSKNKDSQAASSLDIFIQKVWIGPGEICIFLTLPDDWPVESEWLIFLEVTLNFSLLSSTQNLSVNLVFTFEIYSGSDGISPAAQLPPRSKPTISFQRYFPKNLLAFLPDSILAPPRVCSLHSSQCMTLKTEGGSCLPVLRILPCLKSQYSYHVQDHTQSDCLLPFRAHLLKVPASSCIPLCSSHGRLWVGFLLLLPQSLCTFCSLCQNCSSQISHDSLPHFLQVLLKYLLIRESFSELPIKEQPHPYCITFCPPYAAIFVFLVFITHTSHRVLNIPSFICLLPVSHHWNESWNLSPLHVAGS